MLHKVFENLDKALQYETASAHCDIPCKVYDPATAQIAALTVIRMLDLIQELDVQDSLSLVNQAKLTRLMAVKEEHATKVKDEVLIIWGDYYKQPQFDLLPNTNELVHSIMMQASKCKQHIDRAMGEELLRLVNEFAQGFWLTKGVATYTANSPYPPAESVVYPKLG